MQRQQTQIIRGLIPLLKPKGLLVYSTCSLEPEENQQIVQRLLGRSSILRPGEEKYLLPFRDGFDGAFAAQFVRSE